MLEPDEKKDRKLPMAVMCCPSNMHVLEETPNYYGWIGVVVSPALFLPYLLRSLRNELGFLCLN